jgi:pimeloyl-ACP methyl ester carboxylesterase
MANILVRGKKIHYNENSQEPKDKAVIFIHGAGGTNDVWANQVSQIDGYRILALDLPGHGGSEGNASDKIIDYSSFIEEFVRSLNLKSVILAGHSMGGGIVIECALHKNEWLKGAILVSTGSRLRVKKEILEQLEQKKLPFEIIPFMHNTDCPKKIIDDAEDEMEKVSTETYLADFRACDSFDRSKDTGNIDIPVCIICGDEDRMTPLKYSDFLKQAITDSSLAVIPSTGHMCMMENPSDVNKAIVEFLKSIEF